MLHLGSDNHDGYLTQFSYASGAQLCPYDTKGDYELDSALPPPSPPSPPPPPPSPSPPSFSKDDGLDAVARIQSVDEMTEYFQDRKLFASYNGREMDQYLKDRSRAYLVDKQDKLDPAAAVCNTQSVLCALLLVVEAVNDFIIKQVLPVVEELFGLPAQLKKDKDSDFADQESAVEKLEDGSMYQDFPDASYNLVKSAKGKVSGQFLSESEPVRYYSSQGLDFDEAPPAGVDWTREIPSDTPSTEGAFMKQAQLTNENEYYMNYPAKDMYQSRQNEDLPQVIGGPLDRYVYLRSEVGLDASMADWAADAVIDRRQIRGDFIEVEDFPSDGLEEIPLFPPA